MITIAAIEEQSSAKIDASIGLLVNVPENILNKLRKKLAINIDDKNKIELTILYRSSTEEIKSFIEGLGGEFYDLGFNFAIINVEVNNIDEVATSSYIQYIELPKSLYESDLSSSRASCVPQAISMYDVSGKGVLVGFIDSGIDYTHPAFMNQDGNTRIEYIYDLSTDGTVYNKQQIDEAIKSVDPYSIVPEIDDTGHGTHVAGIACGGGKIPNEYRGIAQDASIAMVKGARGKWVLSSQIMKGLKFLLDKSKELNMPLVVNISLSTNNGAHNGSSLLEQYIRIIANLERVTIVIAAGNEGNASHHVGGAFKKTQTKSFVVASDEESLVINFYKSILPDISINIKGPSGFSTGNIKIQEGYFQGSIGRNRYDIYVAGPKPFELESEIQITLAPISLNYLVEGTWSIEINVLNDYEGRYSLWLPILEGLNTRTKFLEPIDLNTLGIPATVDNIIAVGSYNPETRTLSSFSGKGEAYNGTNQIRPDIVAPGENIIGPIPGGGYDKKTGTSMATPQVSGICALFSEWGLVKGNDPYLYGQRLKYYLVKGANRARMDVTYPNPSWGYGTICAFDSFYILENTLNAILSQRSRGIKSSSHTRITNYSEESLQGLLDDIEKYGANKDEVIAFIIEYSKKEEIDEINKIPDTTAIPISEFYAVVHVPLKYLNELSKYAKEIIIYYNPPVYTLTALSPIEASGAPLFVDNPYLRLDGTDTLVAIIDTGIDYLNEEFMLEDDTTRIVRILDQTIEGTNQKIDDSPIFGMQYTENQINEAIKLYKQGGDPYTIVPSKDENGHGTMTAGIIGGRGRNPDLRGAAPNCKFIIVKLKPLGKNSLEYSGVPGDLKYVYGEPEILLALRYLSLINTELKLPMVVYFPLGTNVGAHAGTGGVERDLEMTARKVGFIPVAGTGNEGDTQTHTEGKFENNNEASIEIKVGKNQKYLNLNVYFSKPDKVEVGIVSPSGEVLEKVDIKLRKIKDYKFIYEGTIVSIYYLDPFLETGEEVAVFKFRDIREGIWTIRLYGERIIEGRYWSWLSQRELLDKDTKFITPTQTTTLTIPATSYGVISSADYNQNLNTTVASSGRGYTKDGRIKPDIASGGVNALVTKPGGGTTVATGSSVASSVLAGCCALMLQWAVIQKNDPGITLTTLITYIISGAKMREGDIYPNKEWGYGMLDIQNIFNALRSNKRINAHISSEIKFADFNELREQICEKYKEFSIGSLFLRIPK